MDGDKSEDDRSENEQERPTSVEIKEDENPSMVGIEQKKETDSGWKFQNDAVAKVPTYRYFYEDYINC